ncbi:MAG: glycosyltransferase [Thermoleophilia bacterium]
MAVDRPAIADVFFTSELGESAVSLNDEMKKRCPSWLTRLASRSGLVKGVVFFWLGRSHPVILAVCDAPGTWTLMFLEAWLGGPGKGHTVRRRRIIFLEFIRRQPSGWRRLIYPFWFRLMARPAVRRSMLVGQVLTEWELDRYEALFSIPRERLVYIPWPLRAASDELPPFDYMDNSDMVVSSGRPACDWETLFEASEGRPWPLTVVCGAKDLGRIQNLNRDGRARVLSDISYAEHGALLKQAAVYVISMKETEGSAGQVRFSDAVRAGAPVVATAIRGLEGYIRDGETGILVMPGDWQGMRVAIETLLADREKRRSLRRAAFDYAEGWTYEKYFNRMKELVEQARESGNQIQTQ